MDDYYECLHHRKEVSCPVTLNQDHDRSMWLIKVNHGFPTSWQGQNHYRLHIGRRSWNFRARIHQEQAQFGIWGCWIRRRIVRLFWRQARSGNCSMPTKRVCRLFLSEFSLDCGWIEEIAMPLGSSPVCMYGCVFSVSCHVSNIIHTVNPYDTNMLNRLAPQINKARAMFNFLPHSFLVVNDAISKISSDFHSFVDVTCY